MSVLRHNIDVGADLEFLYKAHDIFAVSTQLHGTAFVNHVLLLKAKILLGRDRFNRYLRVSCPVPRNVDWVGAALLDLTFDVILVDLRSVALLQQDHRERGLAEATRLEE